MLKKTIIIAFLAVVALIPVSAVPAYRGLVPCIQPDGSVLHLRLSGDEFFNVTTTEDGAACIRDKDGWWCYASYDKDGIKHSTGVRIRPGHTADAPAEARNIPYATLLSRKSATMKVLNERRVQAARATASPSTKGPSSTMKAIVILAQFPDLKFKYTRANFVDMLTKTGYSFAGAEGSALDYFRAQFDGKYNFVFDVGPIVTLSKNHAEYGYNNGEYERAARAVAEACRLADAEVDFSQYDIDSDGEVDNVFVFVAGQDAAQGAGDDHIWPHQWYLDAAGIRLSLDGKTISRYAVSTEITHNTVTWSEAFATIGTFCHEFSHCLGLMDLYDTDYEGSGGEADGVWGSTSLMDHGSYNNSGNTPPNYNSLELSTLGIGIQEALDTGPWTLAPLSTEKRYIRAETDNEGEYFLFECRNAAGWDKYIGGEGMLIYHVDQSNGSAGYSDYYHMTLTAAQRWEYDEVNCRPSHMCCYLKTAAPNPTKVSQVFWPYGTSTSFSPDTTPQYAFWSGGIPDISISGITRSDGKVSFNAVSDLSFQKIEAFQDAAIVQWTAIGSPNCCISIKSSSGTAKEYTITPYRPGEYTYTFEGLDEKTVYTVSIYPKGGESKKVSEEFTTKAYYSNGYPFIYLNSAQRYTDGTFKIGTKMPLRVFNAKDVAEVLWYFSSNTLKNDNSGYYIIQGSGTIKAAVTYKNGNKEIISKTITAK